MSESVCMTFDAACCRNCSESECLHPQNSSEFAVQEIIPNFVLLWIEADDPKEESADVDPDSDLDCVSLGAW
jgi:hypothetical protein